MGIALILKAPRVAKAVRLWGAVRRVGQAFLAERDRWALWLPVMLAGGIGLYFALPFEPERAFAMSLGAAGILIALIALLTTETFVQAALAIVAALLIGFGVAKLRTENVAAPVLAYRIGPVEMVGRVEFAQSHGKGVRAVIALEHVARDYGRPMPKEVRVSFRDDEGLLVPGARISFKAVLQPPPAPASPGDYDFGRAAWFLGLGAVGYAYGPPALLTPAPPSGFAERIACLVLHFRWRISQRIHAVLPGSTGRDCIRDHHRRSRRHFR